MPWNHVILVQIRYEVNNKWCQWRKYMYQYLLYNKKIWLNTRSNFVDNKYFCTSPRLNPESFKCNFNRFKRNLTLKYFKNCGKGHFRGLGRDDHQLNFFMRPYFSVFIFISSSNGVAHRSLQSWNHDSKRVYTTCLNHKHANNLHCLSFNVTILPREQAGMPNPGMPNAAPKCRTHRAGMPNGVNALSRNAELTGPQCRMQLLISNSWMNEWMNVCLIANMSWLNKSWFNLPPTDTLVVDCNRWTNACCSFFDCRLSIKLICTCVHCTPDIVI